MPTHSGRILVIDDDPTVREALSAALIPPYEVCLASTGSAALEVARRRLPDLALLDYVLPDVSGLALLDFFRQVFPSVPIILITGFGSEDVSVAAFRGGVQDYLKKPIRVEELLARVGRCLDPSSHLRESPSANLRITSVPVLVTPEISRNAGIQRSLAFIEAHLDSQLSLDQVAREAGMSKFHFCRQFKASTGLTFRRFLARLRIASAIEILRDPGRTLTEVFLDVGFKGPSHFSRVFRKITGQPPSRYRRAASERR